MNGLRGSCLSMVSSAWVRWPVMMLGSNDGLLTIARILPVEGSTTTTADAAVRDTAFSASRWSSASIGSTRFAPGTAGTPRSPWISADAVDALLAAQVVLPLVLEAVAPDQL